MQTKDKAAQLVAKLATMSAAAVYIDLIAVCEEHSPEEIDFYWRKIVKGE